MNLRSLLRSLAAAALAVGAAQATLVERVSLEQLVDGSARIVQGRCLRTWSAWDATHQNIWTHSEIQVTDLLKGDAGQTVVVSELGGEVGDLGMRVEGMPQYQPGEEMVLFLYQTPIGLWRTRGLGQGKFIVLRDAPAGAARVRADLQTAALTEPAGGAPQGTDLRRLDGLALDSFKTQVRALVKRPAAAAR
jgi:hypothetical protein